MPNIIINSPITPLPKNLYLFHGSDSYSAHQKVEHWKKAFIEKHGDLNLQILTGEELTAGDVNEAICTVPFLSEKKLIIIKDFLSEASDDDQKRVAEIIEDVPDYCVLVFIERQKPDARKTLYKKLGKIGQVIEFSDLDKPKLIQWIVNETAKKQGRISSREAEILADLVGPDLWQLSQEVEKLTLHAEGKPITSRDIESLASANISASVFKLTDYVGQRNHRLAIKTLNLLIESGQDIFQIFFMLIRHFRILIQVKALLEKKYERQQIVTATKEHPFVISTAITQSKNFPFETLKGIYGKLLEIDIATKSGGIKTTTGDNSELRLAVEQLLLNGMATKR